MSTNSPIPLFFWSSVLFEKKPHENYGDLLSKFIVEKVSDREIRFYNVPKKRKSWFKKKHLLAIGSIMSYATTKSHIWGSGIISKKDQFECATFHAVRGPKTRDRVMELGFKCPDVYGDPAILLPKYYNPKIEKQYKLGVIPHYVDYNKAKELFKDHSEIRVIELISDNLKSTTDAILSCERTISSSLHGIIVSHAYGIPSIWTRFSNKLTGDNIKFEDYLSSVRLEPYEGKLIEEFNSIEELEGIFNRDNVLPNDTVIKRLQDGLIESFPSII